MRKSLDQRFFYLSSLVIAPVGYIFSIFYYFYLDATKSGITVFAGTSLFLISILIGRNMSSKIQMNIGVMTYFIVFGFIIFFTGGVESPNIWWLPLGAVLCLNFLPKRDTVFWSIFVVSFIALIQVPGVDKYVINEIALTKRRIFANTSLTFFAISTGLLVYIGKTYAEIIFKENNRSMKLLESQNRLTSLGMLAGNVSHEIKNPLQVLIGASEFIREEATKESPDMKNILKHSSRIDLKVHDISEIIDGLRLLSRDGKNDEIQNISVEDILIEVNNIIKTDMGDVRFEFSSATNIADKNLNICTNKVLLIRVLTNLITNSAYAIKENNEKWIKLFVTEDEQSLKLRIADSGNGIPQEILENIYEPLFTTKPDGEGTGIGLALCNDIIESLGGKLRYELFNGNTSFLICLPKQLKLRQTS